MDLSFLKLNANYKNPALGHWLVQSMAPKMRPPPAPTIYSKASNTQYSIAYLGNIDPI